MNCRHAWNRAFLDAHLTRTWVEGALRKHREAILFDRERSLLPITQDAVAAEVRHRRQTEELRALREEVTRVSNELSVNDSEFIMMCVRPSEDNLDERIRLAGIVKEKKATMRLLKEQIRILRHLIRYPVAASAEPETRRQFIAACPKGDCRGFLSTAYKCGTCETQFCSQCRELKADGHECNADLVATIREIQRDSRPCPHCGTAISRVSGCDQMYCISCDTAFSYQTGQVVRGVIHNPHYFERMRAGQVAEHRQEGDLPCGGWPALTALLGYVTIPEYITRLYQSARHIEEVILPVYPRETDRVDNTNLRVRYLLKELNEAMLRQHLQRRERKRQMDLEIRGPLELFVVSTLELFQKIVAEKVLYKSCFVEYEELIETTVNAPLRTIGDRYRKASPQVNLTNAHPYAMFESTGHVPDALKRGKAEAEETDTV